MLALDLRRQDSHHHPHPHHLHYNDHLPSPSTQPSHLAFFNRLPHTATTPSPSDFNGKTTQAGYFESLAAFESQSNSQSFDNDQYMSNNFPYQNPAIRVQQSTPTPGLQLPASNQNQSVPFDGNAYAQLWSAFGSNGQMVATNSLQSPSINGTRSHQRAPSSSSIGSSGSASPFSQGGHAPSYSSYAVSEPSPTVNTATKLSQSYNVDQSSNGFSNHLPTPTQTPTHDTFLASSYQNYNQQGSLDSTVAAHMAMNTAIDHHNADEELPGMSHSGRQSLSSLGQEPSTPRTVAGESYDDFKAPSHDPLRQNFPKLDRTVSDAYQDELYNPAMQASIPQPSTKKPTKQYLTPHRNMITERLQAAQIARSQSPTSATSRGVSPFRQGSPYIQDAYMRFGTASQARQHQKAQADAVELSQHMPQQQNTQPKTISPKDAVLEYSESEEDAKMPLFPESESASYGQQFGGGQQNYQAGVQNFAPIDTSRAANWSNAGRQSASTFPNTPISAQQQNSGFNFASPSMSGNIGSLPFSSQNYRPANSGMSSMKQEDTPDFPAHLTSMESSASEAPQSSSNSQGAETQKPTSSLADTGTYTCTYHGCTLRFETPQKLQKHKRDGHRNPAGAQQAASPGVGSAMTSAAIMQRNSQAGPHKCERINPTTGKPCNTIFSRPYDLTRHEDTIHNARKQKVRCALCVEEKTFSRNDALTRHMRVVHPEVDFPGKHRRRGAHDA